MDSPVPLAPKRRKPTYRRIAEDLRDEIMSGRRAPGVQLPSTNELAGVWNASPYTVHTALTTLVKEGWLERLNGTGTYVIDPGKRFVRAGIYHALDICANENSAFVRNVHAALLKRFKEMGKETQVFVDTRPAEQQVELLPALEKAIQERSIQCLIAPSLRGTCTPAINRIKLPTAFIGNPASPLQIDCDFEEMFNESVRHLATQGCRSVGLLSNVNSSIEGKWSKFYPLFEASVRRAGLVTRPEWIRRPDHSLLDAELEGHGYAEFFRLWQLEDKPDGLIVYPDSLVRGFITAVLELGIQVVPPRMKFILHRNAHIAQMCPFPATWAITDEEAWAGGLISIVEKQFSGDKFSPLFIPFGFEENVPPAR